MLSKIKISPSPHISQRRSTRVVMLDVVIALVPAIAAAGYYFRFAALNLIMACVISCVLTEWVCNVIRQKPNSLADLSAVVTGIILALSVPPSLPIWAAVIGGVFSIAIGKMVFGGLGSNVFNPAMVGRAFLTASFGVLMTTWTVPATIESEQAVISASNTVNARTQATPLAWSKQAIKHEQDPKQLNQQIVPSLTGEIGGCLGETSTIALLLGGIYLLIRKTITWHTPFAVLAGAFVFAEIAWLIDPETYVNPAFHLTTGGMLIGAFFIATDPVTAPLTKKGMLIFGAGVGLLVMLIRIVGEYPEGVMYAILLMNAVAPLIDRFTKLIPIGGKPNVKN